MSSSDASTPRLIAAVCEALAPATLADAGARLARSLLASCDRAGRLPGARRAELEMLIAALEDSLA